MSKSGSRRLREEIRRLENQKSGNPVARKLASPEFRRRVVRNKKGYTRKEKHRHDASPSGYFAL